MAKTKKADQVKAVQPSEKELAEQVQEERKTGFINLFKFRNLTNASTCEAKDMRIPVDTRGYNPDGEDIGKFVDIEARWLAMEVDSKTWVGLDDMSLALQGAPLNAKGRYMKRTKDDKPIRYGFQWVRVKVYLDDAGKPTGELA